MKFAIILATWNRGPLLPRAIDSVIAQTYPNWTLYVIDDGSTDNTRFMVAPYLVDSRIRYVRLEENRGKMNALNVGLDRIRMDGADWFTLMDDDDQLIDDCLDSVFSQMRRYPDCGLFIFSVVDLDGTSITRMKVTGPRDYCWNRMLTKNVTGDAHEFGIVRFLENQKFHAPARSAMLRIFFGEFSLKAGSVFCGRPTMIKEYLPDGITMTRRKETRRKRTEGRLMRTRYRLHVWRKVIRHHPGALRVYCVHGKLIFHFIQYRILSWLLVRDRSTSHGSENTPHRS